MLGNLLLGNVALVESEVAHTHQARELVGERFHCFCLRGVVCFVFPQPTARMPLEIPFSGVAAS